MDQNGFVLKISYSQVWSFMMLTINITILGTGYT